MAPPNTTLTAAGVPALPCVRSYCKRILSPTFWGGEPELLVLSQMLKVPIFVYIPGKEAGRYGAVRPSILQTSRPSKPGPVSCLCSKGGRAGYVVIQKYGEKYERAPSGKRRRAVRLLYSGSNHYDLLLKR